MPPIVVENMLGRRSCAGLCFCWSFTSPFRAGEHSTSASEPGHALQMDASIERPHRARTAVGANMPNLPFSKTNTVAEQVDPVLALRVHSFSLVTGGNQVVPLAWPNAIASAVCGRAGQFRADFGRTCGLW